MDNDDSTPEVEVKEVDTAVQGGPLAGVDVTGVVTEGRVSYFFSLEVMAPLLNNDPVDRDFHRALNLLIEAGLSFKAFSWASLDYRFKLLREPQILDKVQIQNSLLLTFSYALAKSRAGK